MQSLSEINGPENRNPRKGDSSAGAGVGLPHFEQKRSSAVMLFEHFWHLSMCGFRNTLSQVANRFTG